MSSSRTRVVLAGVLASTLLLATACSDSKRIEGADATSTSSADSTTSSSAPESSTTVVDTTPVDTVDTTVVETTVPATAAPTTVAGGGGGGGGGGGVALGQPTTLQPVSSPSVILPSDFICDGTDPGIPGWAVEDCQQMPSYDDGVTTLIARRSDDGRYGVFVLFRSAGSLRSTYEAYEPGPGTWDGVVVQLGDYHFDDGAEVWVGYRYAGTGSYLDLDVLDPQPSGDYFLGGLQGLDGGQVDLHPGGATVLTSVFAASDPNCCPSSFLVREITWAADQWRIDAGTTYPSASAPAVFSDF